jgi:hypothetical protein
MPRIAMTLNTLGILLRREGRFDGTEGAYKEAIEIYEEFVLKVPTVYEKDLVKTLSNYSILLSEIENNDDISDQVKTRLKELGVEQTPEIEKWLEEEETSIR